MPRPKNPGVEPKKRSRNGCWPCKARKVKCGEEKPHCTNCVRQGETCDYSIRLTWGGRNKPARSGVGSDISSAGSGSPYQTTFSFEEDVPALLPLTPEPIAPSSHVRSRSNVSPPTSSQFAVDPTLLRMSQSRTPPLTSTSAAFDYSQHGEQLPTSAPHSQSQFESPSSAQTPAGPGQDHYAHHIGFSTINVDAPFAHSSMPPPQISVEPTHEQYNGSHGISSPPTTLSDGNSPYTGPLELYSPYMAMPLTPDSPVGPEEPEMGDSANEAPPPDLRRMSLQSIINDDRTEHSKNLGQGRQYPIADHITTTYGYDLGLPDLDTPNNDDYAAIRIFSPQADTMELDDDTPYGSADPRSKDMAFESGGYYAKPVAIRISKSLGALPPILMENQMNLLYFHHFHNHTARILVPHDCERNPFRQILPEMAIQDENIMNLLLAYSAAHRARMLNHPEPANRIAVWVQDVFPRLRQTLIENPNHVSDNTLAAIIMMASLEIISSGTFAVSWQNHLTMARQMIIARGGPRGMGREDRVAYFLSRWFAYLDVLGSLSGNKNDVPLGSSYWSNQNAAADADFEIDCLMGFTTRCVGSLARISELAKTCEPQRIDAEGNVRQGWIPSSDVVKQAIQIRHALEEGLLQRNIRKGCNHRSSTSTESEGAWDATEIYATNELFHWAGLIHLYRRVLGKAAADVEVQNAVREIVGLLYKIRRGSTAEACLIFPMFTAGCDTLDQGQREKIMERLRSVEGFGMTHTPKVATLLKSVWDTGKPWESLVSGEFFG